MLFDYKCDILARLMYIKMSRKKDKSKIDFDKFANCLIGLLDEVKDVRNQTIFNLLDYKNEGELSIMFMMQLIHNVPKNSMFGQEILKLVKEYKIKNLMSRGGSRKIQLNFQVFNNLVPYSSLIDEFQYKIFGIYVPDKK